jgi:hypothetical protein
MLGQQDCGWLGYREHTMIGHENTEKLLHSYGTDSCWQWTYTSIGVFYVANI